MTFSEVVTKVFVFAGGVSRDARVRYAAACYIGGYVWAWIMQQTLLGFAHRCLKGDWS